MRLSAAGMQGARLRTLGCFERFAERRTNDLNDGLAVGGFASRSALTGSCSKCDRVAAMSC